MSEPFLHLGDIGFVGERVRRRRCPQGVYAQPDHLGIDARGAAVFLDDVAVDRAGLQVFIQRTRAVVFHGAEEGTIQRPAVFRQRQASGVIQNRPGP